MHTNEQKYGAFRVVRGGQYGQPRQSRVRLPIEHQLDRHMRDAFIAMLADDGTVPSRGIKAVRNDEQWPWRIIARRIIEARERNVEQSAVLRIAHVLEGFIRHLYAAPHGRWDWAA